jgi:hypothetical protein
MSETPTECTCGHLPYITAGQYLGWLVICDNCHDEDAGWKHGETVAEAVANWNEAIEDEREEA